MSKTIGLDANALAQVRDLTGFVLLRDVKKHRYFGCTKNQGISVIPR